MWKWVFGRALRFDIHPADQSQSLAMAAGMAWSVNIKTHLVSRWKSWRDPPCSDSLLMSIFTKSLAFSKNLPPGSSSTDLMWVRMCAMIKRISQGGMSEITHNLVPHFRRHYPFSSGKLWCVPAQQFSTLRSGLRCKWEKSRAHSDWII